MKYVNVNNLKVLYYDTLCDIDNLDLNKGTVTIWNRGVRTTYSMAEVYIQLVLN